MSKQVIVIIIAILTVLLLIYGLNSLKDKQPEESSAEESIIMMTDIIIVPSEMPSRISFKVPPGFQETSSEAYDKFYTREDASVIITGEDLVIRGIELDEYVTRVKEQYAKTADEYKEIGDTATDLKDDLPCRVLEFSYAIIGTDVHQEMQCITAVILKDNFAYIITCKSKKETFMTYRASFLQMIESIEVADADSTQSDLPAQNDTTTAVVQTVS